MKNYLFLLVYFIICYFFNIAVLNDRISVLNFSNLLFYNYSSFEMYGLGKICIQYIIHFYLLSIIILNILMTNMYENSSFIKLVIYRRGIYNTVIDFLKNIILKIISLFVLINIIIILESRILENYNFIINQLLTLNLYLTKYFIIFIFLLITQFLETINDNFSKKLVSINFIILFLIFIDIIFGVNIITFSGNLNTEIKYLLFYIILLIIYFIIIKFKYKKEE